MERPGAVRQGLHEFTLHFISMQAPDLSSAVCVVATSGHVMWSCAGKGKHHVTLGHSGLLHLIHFSLTLSFC